MKPYLETEKGRNFKKVFIANGAAIFISVLMIFKGFHGVPAAVELLFGIDSSSIGRDTLEYSKHDLWIAQQGIFSLVAMISFVIFLVVFMRKLKALNNTLK